VLGAGKIRVRAGCEFRDPEEGDGLAYHAPNSEPSRRLLGFFRSGLL
jgi:hypothetical protein